MIGRGTIFSRSKIVEGDALVGMIEKLRQDALALLDRRAPQVLAVEFEEVERAEHGGGIMTLLRADDDHRSVGLPATPRSRPATGPSGMKF